MADSTGKTTDGNAVRGAEKFRCILATVIMGFVFLVTGTIGTVALVVAGKSNSFDNVKEILAILLPVLAAWAGTILAFYFSRENFESASRSAAALVKQLTPDEKLRSIAVKGAMISMGEAATFPLNKPEAEVKLTADMIATLVEKKRERLPILDPAGIVKYIAHKSLINDFIVQRLKPDPPKKPDEWSLADMLEDTAFKGILTAFATLRETATLADAKVLMDNLPNCADVFVTEDGTANTKAIGWVTNVIVREQATV